MFRVDMPHDGKMYPHINPQGYAEAVFANHTPVSPTTLKVFQNVGPVVRGAQRALTVAEVAADGYELYGAYEADGSSCGHNTVVAAGGIAGSWASGWARAEAGAAGGAAVGTLIFPV